jgi:hypothetical protein
MTTLAPTEIATRHGTQLARADKLQREAAEFYRKGREATGKARDHLFLKAAQLETQSRGWRVLAARDRLDAEQAIAIARS